MIYRAIINSLEDNGYQAKIRIPYLDRAPTVAGALPQFDLYTACISTTPGCYPTYIPGDVVYVDFEQDDMSRPIIIGALYRQNMLSKVNIFADDISADSELKIISKDGIKKSLFDTVSGGGGDSLPDQAGNDGKALVTDGTNPYWSTISGTVPAVTSANNGQFLRVVDGEWAVAGASVYNGETS